MNALLVLVLGLLSPGGPSRAADSHPSEFAVVTSPDVKLDALTSVELRRVFRLERRFWNSGSPIVVLMPASDSRSRKVLLRQICRCNEGEMRSLVLGKMYQGEIDYAPKVVKSDEEAVSFLSASEGLVAVIPASLVRGDLKVLSIDGKLPGTAGYPFRE